MTKNASESTQKQLKLIIKIDKLKNVLRQTLLIDILHNFQQSPENVITRLIKKF